MPWHTLHLEAWRLAFSLEFTHYGLHVESPYSAHWVLLKSVKNLIFQADAIVAILLATGLGAGVILVSMSDDLEIHDIEEFLFGSAIIDTQNVITILVMAGAILAILFFTYKKLLYSTFSEEQARASGIPVEKMGYLLIAMAGVTVVISMQLVGVLLISALFVLPQCFCHPLRALLQEDNDAFNVLCSIRYRLGHIHFIPVLILPSLAV